MYHPDLGYRMKLLTNQEEKSSLHAHCINISTKLIFVEDVGPNLCIARAFLCSNRQSLAIINGLLAI